MLLAFAILDQHIDCAHLDSKGAFAYMHSIVAASDFPVELSRVISTRFISPFSVVVLSKAKGGGSSKVCTASSALQ